MQGQSRDSLSPRDCGGPEEDSRTQDIDDPRRLHGQTAAVGSTCQFPGASPRRSCVVPRYCSFCHHRERPFFVFVFLLCVVGMERRRLPQVKVEFAGAESQAIRDHLKRWRDGQRANGDLRLRPPPHLDIKRYVLFFVVLLFLSSSLLPPSAVAACVDCAVCVAAHAGAMWSISPRQPGSASRRA